MSSISHLAGGQAARRAFMKTLLAAPLFASIATRSFADTVAAGVSKAAGNPYARLGVRTIINARGTFTYLSGCLELPEVRRAAEAASHHFVDIYELQAAAGRRLAEISGAESGMDAPSGHLLHGSDHLGVLAGCAEGHRTHERAEADAGGLTCEGRERDPRVRSTRARVSVAHEQVVIAPEERVEPEVLGATGDREELVVGGPLLGLGEDAQQHARTLTEGVRNGTGRLW